MNYLYEIEVIVGRLSLLRQEMQHCQYKGQEFKKWENNVRQEVKALNSKLKDFDFEMSVFKSMTSNDTNGKQGNTLL